MKRCPPEEESATDSAGMMKNFKTLNKMKDSSKRLRH